MHDKNAPQSPRLAQAGTSPKAGSSLRGLPRLGIWLALLAGTAGLHAQPAPPTTPRQQELVRMVRQDCGSCHGLRLTGGLGPALTREALADKPFESIVATIYYGRPGTPMAPWKAMLSETDARWIAQQLFAGFPESVKDRP
ncbi:cytochrome c [Acidovorax sp. JHL-9]|uniref:c-type cytochrome n=1 Tax=Acidovorax sp. JHL-9 TaxID=1276756 RepID=UPI0004042575|nr:cytochrome c [Acidovorax sp. JHL-9]